MVAFFSLEINPAKDKGLIPVLKELQKKKLMKSCKREAAWADSLPNRSRKKVHKLNSSH